MIITTKTGECDCCHNHRSGLFIESTKKIRAFFLCRECVRILNSINTIPEYLKVEVKERKL